MKPQVTEGLGDVSRLAVLPGWGLSGAQEAALSGFGVFSRGPLAWRRGEILRSVGRHAWLKYTQAHVLKVLPSRPGERVSSAPCASALPAFLSQPFAIHRARLLS